MFYYCPGGFCPGGYWNGEILGGYCPGGYCPDTWYSTPWAVSMLCPVSTINPLPLTKFYCSEFFLPAGCFVSKHCFWRPLVACLKTTQAWSAQCLCPLEPP